MEDFDAVAAGVAPPPPFPTLQVTSPAASSKQWHEQLPTSAPFAIDNAYFVGKALLMLKADPPYEDVRYGHIFKGKRRLIEIQVQGRFKVTRLRGCLRPHTQGA